MFVSMAIENHSVYGIIIYGYMERKIAMKYCVTDQPGLFEFHDSEFTLISLGGGELVVSVKYLNIHKHTIQNPSEHDMEIGHAKMNFKGFRKPSYEVGRTWKKDAQGNSYPVGPKIIYFGQEAEEKIREELLDKIAVFDFNKKEDNRYSIDGSGVAPFFTMEFCCDHVIVEWDEYQKKAWYELHRQQ